MRNNNDNRPANIQSNYLPQINQNNRNNLNSYNNSKSSPNMLSYSGADAHGRNYNTITPTRMEQITKHAPKIEIDINDANGITTKDTRSSEHTNMLDKGNINQSSAKMLPPWANNGQSLKKLPKQASYLISEPSQDRMQSWDRKRSITDHSPDVVIQG